MAASSSLVTNPWGTGWAVYFRMLLLLLIVSTSASSTLSLPPVPGDFKHTRSIGDTRAFAKDYSSAYVPRIRGLAVVRQMCKLLLGGLCRLVNAPCEDTSTSVVGLCVSSRLDKRRRSAKLSVCVNVSPVKGVLK